MISDRGFRPLSFLIARVVDDRAAWTNWPFSRMSRNVQRQLAGLLCASAARADYRAWRFAIGVVCVGAERISESDPMLRSVRVLGPKVPHFMNLRCRPSLRVLPLPMDRKALDFEVEGKFFPFIVDRHPGDLRIPSRNSILRIGARWSAHHTENMPISFQPKASALFLRSKAGSNRGRRDPARGLPTGWLVS
jgi:hypothetical protein